MYCRHKPFHTLFDLLKYGLMSKYNVMCSSLDPMEELTASPPYPSWSRTWAWVICSPPPPPPPHTHTHKLEILDPSLKLNVLTLLSGSAELQDALKMKESPLKNSFCCLHHHLLLKCLTLAPTNNPYTNTICMKLFTLWRYHTYTCMYMYVCCMHGAKVLPQQNS